MICPGQIRILIVAVVLFICPSASTSDMVTLTVTNNSNEVNGNTSSPNALMNDPGADGISLTEAIQAANSAAGSHSINFDPSMKGAAITAPDGLPPLTRAGLTINGDIDGDGNPDITLNGAHSTISGCFRIRASDITIAGFTILGFDKAGILAAASDGEGVQRIERITLRGNAITAGWSGIKIASGGRDRAIHNIDILNNRLVNNGFEGIGIDAAFWDSTSTNNRITNITIKGNVISNNGFTHAIFATGGSQTGVMNNVIADLEISDNTIQGHTNTAVLITGGNASKAQGNRVETLFIRRNSIQGESVGIEIVGGVGEDSAENFVSHATIEGNRMEQEGIMLVGSQSGNKNGVNDFLICRNKVLNSADQAFQAQGGSFGATNSTVEKITIADNLIAKSSGSGILLLGGFDHSLNNTIKDISVLNNTLTENGNISWAGGINIENNNNSSGNIVTGVKIANTILWNNMQSDQIAGPQTPDSVQNCILGDARYLGSNGNFYLSPQFADPSQLDYRLQRASPAIDKGATSGVDPGRFDLDGYPRSQDGDGDGTAVTDIGAYEITRGGAIFRKLTIASDTHGRTDPGPGVFYVQVGAQITVTAVPKSGCEFRNWSGDAAGTENPLTVTMDVDRSIAANFGLPAPPAIAMSRQSLDFGAVEGGVKTADQQFRITNSGSGTLDWTVADDAAWLTCAPAAGTGNAAVTVSVNPAGLAAGLTAGNYTGTITISAAGAANSPQTITVYLTVKAVGTTLAPFGEFSTPVDGTAGVTGAIPVTGWVVDDIEVVRVDVKRDPVAGDPTGAIGPDGLVYVGDGLFVEGARPDIEIGYPGYPMNYKAGWGYMLLTNFLPAQGNGTYKLHAFAADKEGNYALLGSKTIVCDNAHATKPFGTIDTPTQGGTAAG